MRCAAARTLAAAALAAAAAIAGCTPRGGRAGGGEGGPMAETFPPRWEAGKSWKVRWRRLAPSAAGVPHEGVESVEETWDYTVEGQDERSGERCWIVRAGDAGPWAREVKRLYFRVGSRSLLGIATAEKAGEKELSFDPNPWKDETFVEERSIGMLDWPLLRLPAPPAREVAGGPRPLKQWVRSAPDGSVEVMVGAALEGVPCETVFVFAPGLPWWREMRRTSRGKELVRGELVR